MDDAGALPQILFVRLREWQKRGADEGPRQSVGEAAARAREWRAVSMGKLSSSL